MKSKQKYQSLTAQKLSEQTGIPLEQVEKAMRKSFTLEEISKMTGIPIETVKKRAHKEGWPISESSVAGDEK